MTIECTGYLDMKHEAMCYRCGGGATLLWVMVVDGNTDDEQYICDACVSIFHASPTSFRIGKPEQAQGEK